jgi:chaperonin GroES
MKLKPLGNRIIIKPDPVPEEIKTKGGIIVPDEVVDRKKASVETGVVQTVGPGIRNNDGNYMPLVVKEGDRVAYNHLAVFQTKVPDGDGVEHVFLYIKESDIIAIIEG